MRAVVSTIVMGLMVAGCAAKPVETVSVAAPTRSPATRAELIAVALEDADAAAAAQDYTALSRALAVLEAAGARPMEGVIDDPVPEWRSNAVSAEPPMRGLLLGPGYRSGRIAAGGRDSFAQLFLSGTASTIALTSPTGDRVALSVVDNQDKSVCRSDPSRSGACRWVPLFTQRYTIQVQNMGNSDARYFLVIE